MAIIKDTIISGIEGYETMTAEQKVAALEAAALPEADYSGYVKKDLYDKKVSDLAKANDKIRGMESATLSEAEKTAQERRQLDEDRKAFSRERNGVMIRGILNDGGLKPEQYKRFNLDIFEDEAEAKAYAETILEFAKEQRSAADKAARNDALGGGSAPTGGSTAGKETAIRSKYADAVKNGDTFGIARAIREAAEIGVTLT